MARPHSINPDTGTKVCTLCKTEKSLDTFTVEKARKGRGPSWKSWCKPCAALYMREKHPPKYELCPDLPEEIWRTCVQDERYEVSNLGRVKRVMFTRYTRQYPRIVTGIKTTNGYLVVNLGRNGPRVPIHRLVAYAFIGEPLEHQTDVNHKDHDRTNNRADNLEWTTRTENLQWAKLHDRNNRGDRNGRSKLTEDSVREIIHLLKTTKLTHTAIGNQFNVSDGAVQLINRGKRWSYLTKGESIPLQSP